MIHKNIKINNIPKSVEYITNTLQENNYEAYIVGGCVRDSLLGRIPKDWDVTTNARPNEVVSLFESLSHKVIPTGIKHGTVTVMMNKDGFEITTYRVDGEYEDNRRPKEVIFTSSLKEDLSRRDFTINSMAYNEKIGLVDYFEGLRDLENKIIRCVGNANDRFNEDALRMLRCMRFSAQLGFEIEENTKIDICKNDELIQKISQERIQSELNKILLSENPDYIARLYDFELLDDILPEYANCFECGQNNPYHIYNVGVHIEKSVKYIESSLPLRLIMLFHDIGKPLCKITDENGISHFYGHGEVSANMAEIILRRLKYDNDTIKKVTTLVKYHDMRINNDKQIRRLLNKIGEENLRDLLKVREADIKSQNPQYYNERHRKVLFLQDRLNYIIQENNCFQVKDLAIDGKDLIELGFKQGKEIGLTLNELLEIVLEQPQLNNKEALLKLIKEKGINC